MGKLMLPPTENPATNARQGASKPNGPGGASKSGISDAFDRDVEFGNKMNKNPGGTLGFNAGAIKDALK